jgi:cytochrome P450
VKYIPSCLPGAQFKRDAKAWNKEVRAMIDEPFQMVKERMHEGTALSCVVSQELEDPLSQDPQARLSEPHEAIVKNVAGICYSAGVDTTAANIMSFFLAMTLHPEIQTQAQLELDSVVGEGRLPTFSDRNSLPGIDNIVWESSRWQPVAPLAMSHLSTEDYVYAGYFIPKGTMVFPNTWEVLLYFPKIASKIFICHFIGPFYMMQILTPIHWYLILIDINQRTPSRV